MILRLDVFNLSPDSMKCLIRQYEEKPVSVSKTGSTLVVQAEGPFEKLMEYFAIGMRTKYFVMSIVSGGADDG